VAFEGRRHSNQATRVAFEGRRHSNQATRVAFERISRERVSRDVDSCIGGMWTAAEGVLSEAT
jgi:hypothetical protein